MLRQKVIGLIIFFIAAGLFCPPLFAATWSVEQDNSGDFKVIQHAVNAAAPGDTILIGLGRFEESEVHFDQETCVMVEKADLCFIGSGTDQTIIGPPSVQYGSGEAPRGFYFLHAETVNISGLSIENYYYGIVMYYTVGAIDECRFFNCKFGYFGKYNTGGSIVGCNFLDCLTGIQTLGHPENIIVEDCQIVDCSMGASFEGGSTNITVRGCDVSGGAVGVQFASWSTGEVRSSHVSETSNVGILVTTGSSVELYDNFVESCDYVSLKVNDHSEVTQGTGNIFTGSGYGAIGLEFGMATMHNNSFFREPGTFFVTCSNYWEAPLQIDLTGNFWGTQNLSEISEWIWDGNDDPNEHVEVLFDPIGEALSPVTTPKPMVGLSVHPNPFNPRTTVSFTIDQAQIVELSIFDMTGKRIMILADQEFQAGIHSIAWQGLDVQGRAVASGTYLLRMVTDENVVSEKMTLVR